MNIVYISHLNNKISEGPNYSVPARIYAQSKYDNVFWWNKTDAMQKHWLETGLYHNVKDVEAKKISELPAPFNKPDVVVFESFYYLDDLLMSFECIKFKIPYIIVPRSAFTLNAQKKRKIKKFFANYFGFLYMAKNACSIQYLTEQERKESGTKWNKNCFVVPNGFKHVNWDKKIFSVDSINAIYIGRFDPFQKGQDLLIEACLQLKDEMINNNFTITLYGPEGNRHQYRQQLKNSIVEKGLEDIILINEGVFGEEKENILRSADLFIMTSRFEGMPMSLIEALSYGLPCAISEGTNMVDPVSQTDAGWTCETTIDGITEMFKRIICDSKEFSKKSKNAKSLSKKYNWDSIAKETHAIYQQVIN